MKTYPLPGKTRFDSTPLDADTAQRIAYEHYEFIQEIRPLSEQIGHCYAIRTASGWVAQVGLIDGIPAILHKKDDGTRELETFPPDSQEAGETAELQKFALSYAYDVSRYADFSIEASSPEEALRIAQGLLDAGELGDILEGRAKACNSSAANPRVFLMEGVDGNRFDAIEDIAEEERHDLGDDWRELQPKEKEQTEEERLISFARATLATLQAHEDWGGDTIQEIGEHASRLQLATSDEQGNFKAAL